MRDRFLAFAILILAAVLGVYVAQPYVQQSLYSASTPRPIEARGNLSEMERATIGLFEQVSPSVVQVVARTASTNTLPAEGDEGGVQAGTGFIWDKAGHIVTNNHVVQGTEEVVVRFASGDVQRAQIVGATPNYDLAVLRVENTRSLPPPVVIGASADLKVGQSVFAIGNPFGLDQSLTTGIISAIKGRLPTSSGREIANVIQTDAAINPGNSGGPLLDSAGRVIGVNTAILSPSGTSAGIGFAIPVDVVNRVVPEIISKGYVPTPGIGINTASEAATVRAGVEGVVVVSVAPGSAAERAGLHGIDANTRALGDIIVGVNGKPVRRLPDLTEAFEQAGVGKHVTLTVRRGGKDAPIDVEVVDIGHKA